MRNKYVHEAVNVLYWHLSALPFTTGCPFLNSILKVLFLDECLDSEVVTTVRWYFPWLASSKTSNMSPTREV
jgi:hypothetical protein